MTIQIQDLILPNHKDFGRVFQVLTSNGCKVISQSDSGTIYLFHEKIGDIRISDHFVKSHEPGVNLKRGDLQIVCEYLDWGKIQYSEFWSVEFDGIATESYECVCEFGIEIDEAVHIIEEIFKNI